MTKNKFIVFIVSHLIYCIASNFFIFNCLLKIKKIELNIFKNSTVIYIYDRISRRIYNYLE